MALEAPLTTVAFTAMDIQTDIEVVGWLQDDLSAQQGLVSITLPIASRDVLPRPLSVQRLQGQSERDLLTKRSANRCIDVDAVKTAIAYIDIAICLFVNPGFTSYKINRAASRIAPI